MATQPDLPFRLLDTDVSRLLHASRHGDALLLLRNTRNWPRCTLAIFGPNRSGITSLLQAWVHECDGGYVKASDLAGDDPGALARRLARPLAVDDAHADGLGGSLLILINLAAERGQPLLLGGHGAPENWQDGPKDLVSRLSAMTSIGFDRPSLAEFQERLVLAARRRYLQLSKETVEFLAVRIERSFEMIDRVCDALALQASAHGRKPTIPTARIVLEELGTSQTDLFDGPSEQNDYRMRDD